MPYAIAGAGVRSLVSQDTGRTVQVLQARGLVFSAWRASPEELAELNKGRHVWVVIKGPSVPEFQLVVGPRETVVPPDLEYSAIRAATLVKTPMGQDLIKSQERDHWLAEWVFRFYLLCLFATGAAIIFYAVPWILRG